jgi:hypothetical protein
MDGAPGDARFGGSMVAKAVWEWINDLDGSQKSPTISSEIANLSKTSQKVEI